MLNMFHKDIVTLFKQNGERAENIKANVQPKEIFIDVKNNNNMPPIKSGDIIEHKQDNGIVEQYEVCDSRYCNGILGEHYQCSVRKLSVIKHTQAQTKNVFNINANQANVATDNATISTTQNNGVDLEQVKLLIAAIKQTITSDMSSDDVVEVNETLEFLQEELPKSSPKKTMIKTLLTGLKGIIWTAEFADAVEKLANYIKPML